MLSFMTQASNGSNGQIKDSLGILKVWQYKMDVRLTEATSFIIFIFLLVTGYL
jgi:hypothetical protein